MPAYLEVGRRQGGLVDIAEVELKGQPGEHGENIRIDCCQTGCVVEGCPRANRRWCGRFICPTSVVLCAPSDGYMLHHKTFGWRRERSWSCAINRVSLWSKSS